MANPKAPMPPEAAMYWIHCNRCFDIYIRKQRRHFLLACHHIACEKCVVEYPAESPIGPPSFKCPLCSKTTRGRPLGNNMPPQIKELFHPQPWLEDLPTMRILRFQDRHRRHFFQGMMRMQRNLIKIQQSCELARESARKKFEELENCRRERKQLERRVHKIIAKRKQLEQERQQREAARRLRPPPPPPLSSTDESNVGGNAQRPQSPHWYRHHYGATSAANVQTANRYKVYSQPRHTHSAGYRPRMPVPESSAAVQSFMSKHTTSFIL